MPRLCLALLLLLAGWASALGAARPAEAGEVALATAGGHFNLPVTSLREKAFQTVLPQQYDFSCGSAALASLLTHHYQAPVTEAQVFEAMYIVGDREKIHRYGFSLLDMKKFLATLGIDADGFRISLDQLAEAGVPAITLLDLNGYKHFVIIKGIRADEVLVGDPARGLQIMDRADFERMWNGILFVIRDDVALAQASFNREAEWQIRPEAPLGAGRDRQGLASFNLNLMRGLNQF